MENTIKINREWETELTDKQFLAFQKQLSETTDIEQLEAEKIKYEEKIAGTKIIINDGFRKVVKSFLNMDDKTVSFGIDQWKQYDLICTTVESEEIEEMDFTTYSLLNNVVQTTRVTTRENINICLDYLAFTKRLNVDISTISRIISLYADRISRLLTEHKTGMKFSEDDTKNHNKLQKLGKN